MEELNNQIEHIHNQLKQFLEEKKEYFNIKNEHNLNERKTENENEKKNSEQMIFEKETLLDRKLQEKKIIDKMIELQTQIYSSIHSLQQSQNVSNEWIEKEDKQIMNEIVNLVEIIKKLKNQKVEKENENEIRNEK